MSLPSPDELRSAASVLRAQAKALDALAKAGAAPARLANELGKLDRAGTADVGAVRSAVTEWLLDEKAGRRERLSTGLRSGCDALGIEILKLSQEPLELRLAPVSVRLDLEGNRSEVLFSQQVLARGDATAEAVLDARRKVVASLETAWDAAAFHTQLRTAWQRAAGSDGWAELADVLPEVALLRQPRAFRVDPVAKRFVPYGRASFAYDLWRLRRDRALTQGAWRLTLGPATGSSTKDKSRVFWLEDDRGQGQYHLTLRFVREPHVAP